MVKPIIEVLWAASGGAEGIPGGASPGAGEGAPTVEEVH